MIKFASFDIEIAKELEDDVDNWQELAPLGITCAAVALSDTKKVTYWHSAPQMSKKYCVQLVHDLQAIVDEGYSIITWNGTGFDFHVLAQESGLFEECGQLALNHLDMMLWVTFTKGWYLALQTALKGAGLEGKLKEVTLSNGTKLDDMSGAKAPKLWAAGEHNAVLAYLKEDVLQPLKLAESIQQTGYIKWRSGKGNAQSVRVGNMRNVLECFGIAEPDTSWMTNPPTRDQFVSWIPDYKNKIEEKEGWITGK